MSATINKSAIQTRFSRRSQPPPLVSDVPQIVTRNSKKSEVDSCDIVKKTSKLWDTSKHTKEDVENDDIDSYDGDVFFPENNQQPPPELVPLDNHTSTSMEGKPKSAKQFRSLVNRLAPSAGFVDKNSVPSDTPNRRRAPRLASLNAAAKVNVFFEPTSSLAGRSLTDIMQHSKKIQAVDTQNSNEPMTDEKENVSRPRGRPKSTSKNSTKPSEVLYNTQNLENADYNSSLLQKRTQDEVDSGIQTKRTKVEENGCYATINSNKRVFMGKEVIDVGLQVELPRIKTKTSGNQCKCRSSKVIDVPIKSYVSTFKNGSLVSIPITKTHRLTPQMPEKPSAELAQGDLACRSKRVAGLNSRAMLNAILAEENTIPAAVQNTAKYRKTSQTKKTFYEHGMNNTIPSALKIPKINFAATSTSNFSAFGRSKSTSQQPSKISTWPKSGILSHDGPKRTNGWFFLEPAVIKPYFYNDCTATRKYYNGIKRNNEVIYVRDSVLLKSGPRRKDLPFVARVSGFWEEIHGPNAGDMMMSVMWYYRPEQTEIGKQPDIHGENEILASRHKDDNSVACIVDKCYVLSYPEYCRYRAAVKRLHDLRCPSTNPVPLGVHQSRKLGDVAPLTADPKLVFFCRQIYDYRMGRVLKNPVACNPNYYT